MRKGRKEEEGNTRGREGERMRAEIVECRERKGKLGGGTAETRRKEGRREGGLRTGGRKKGRMEEREKGEEEQVKGGRGEEGRRKGKEEREQ